MSFAPDPKVFEWLGSDFRGMPYYLKSLRLSWGRGKQEDIQVAVQRFLEVANRLKAEPLYWSEILRTGAWRHTLVGCVCVLLTQDDGHFQDLAFSFEQGNWVAPQIAVTMGIVYPELACQYFTDYLLSSNRERGSKSITSAECVLNKLGSKVDKTFEWNSALERDEASIAVSVVENYWDFWSKFSLESIGIA